MLKQLHTKKTFIDSFRFMSTSLWKLVNGEIKKKWRDKNGKSECEFKYCKNNKPSYRCSECKKKKLKPINGLIKKFSNTYKVCNNDISKFILLLKEGVYSYECMDSWERFNETTLPNKKTFIVNYI